MTLGSQPVVQIGETESQRQRRDWPEAPQGIQKELRWISGLLSPAQFPVREAYPVGTEAQELWLERHQSEVGSTDARRAAGSRPRDSRWEAS